PTRSSATSSRSRCSACPVDTAEGAHPFFSLREHRGGGVAHIEDDEPVPNDCEARSEASVETPGWFDEDLRWALSFWHEAREGDVLPRKARIDPLRFPPRCLDMAFLFEL